MANDYVITTNESGELAVRTVSATEASNITDTLSVITRTDDGKLAVRTVGGSGGGDAHNKGYFATLAELEEAYPTAEAGDYAIVGSTDTVWLWDEDTSAWVDSDQKGQVVSVNSKTGTVVLTAEDVGALPQYNTMPVASSSNSGLAVQYTGATNASYTHDYIYENVATTTPSSATASQTAGSSLTDVAVVVGTFETQITTSGSYVFTSDGADWSYDGNVVDLTDYGIAYTGTPVADDAITVVYTAESTSYAWTRVDVQPTPVIPDPLPSQTGQSGKFLTTDGTDASWSGKPLVNNTTQSLSLAVLGGCASVQSVSLGSSTNTSGAQSVAIGFNAITQSVATRGIAIGRSAVSGAACAIQLGGESGYSTNNDANTFKVGNANGNFEIMSADGTVPHARLTNAVVSNSITIAVADWNGGTTCTKTVSGLTATSTVWVAPDNASQSDYLTAGVYASAQAADSITFTATTTPTSALTVNVIYC